jgi:hypothetical protein
MKFNEEQLEAYQHEVNEANQKFILGLPESAQEKAIKLRYLIGEINKLGTPYYLFIQEPTITGHFWPVQYNNLLEVFPPVNGKIPFENAEFNAEFIFALIQTIAFSSGNLNKKGSPLEIFWSFVMSAVTSVQDNPSPISREEFTNKMNEIWGLNLEPYSINK